ncbi:hypothetical protein N0V94_002501 [Neodidymelliopsis sp. IMI 364377]|nr:hypothetical protein N0V94_002501 [Neodidymelliopsis sp. IMI 364377]
MSDDSIEHQFGPYFRFVDDGAGEYEEGANDGEEMPFLEYDAGRTEDRSNDRDQNIAWRDHEPWYPVDTSSPQQHEEVLDYNTPLPDHDHDYWEERREGADNDDFGNEEHGLSPSPNSRAEPTPTPSPPHLSLRAIREHQQAQYLLGRRLARAGLPYQYRHFTHSAPLSCTEPIETMAPSQPQPDYGSCFLSAQDYNAGAMQRLMQPVEVKLTRLKNTTVPPYTAHLNAKTWAQVLRGRVLPIGRHILKVLEGVEDERKGEVELKICRYVADTYWPSEMGNAGHLRVMEIYRNAAWREKVDVGMEREIEVDREKGRETEREMQQSFLQKVEEMEVEMERVHHQVEEERKGG